MDKHISVCCPPSSTLQFPFSVLNLLSSVLILYFPYFFIRTSSFNLSLFVQLSVCRPSSSVPHPPSSILRPLSSILRLCLFHPPSFVLCPLSSVLRPSSFFDFYLPVSVQLFFILRRPKALDTLNNYPL